MIVQLCFVLSFEHSLMSFCKVSVGVSTSLLSPISTINVSFTSEYGERKKFYYTRCSISLNLVEKIQGKGGALAREGLMFLRGGGVDTRMYTMVLKKLIGLFQKIVHAKAVRLLRIIFLEMVLRQKYTNKLGSAEQIQEIRKWETNLEAKTLSNIVKKK